MPNDNDYFSTESVGPLGILRIKPHQGPALTDIGYSFAVQEAIQAFESESKSVLLVCVPSGNFSPERMDPFWATAREGKPDDRLNSVAYSRPSNLPLSVDRQENGVVSLLKLLQKVNLFKIIAVEGAIDFDLLGLLLAFDVRICGRDTVFENRILDRGVGPGFGVLWYLTRHLGQPATVDLILNQQSIDAEEALRLKLVSRLTDGGTVVDEATQYANDVAEKPAAVIQSLVKTAEFLSGDFESYLRQVGGGFKKIPVG